MKLVHILSRINTYTFKVPWGTEKESAAMQKHLFNLQFTRYLCGSVECTWSVLNHSSLLHMCLNVSMKQEEKDPSYS